MTTAPKPTRVLIVGRSAAERSVIAAAFRRAGDDAIELSRAAELDLPTLKGARFVIALDQHRFVQKTLQEAQDYGFLPLFLPVQLEDAETSAQPDPHAPAPDAEAVDGATRTADSRAAVDKLAADVAAIESLAAGATDAAQAPALEAIQQQLASLAKRVAEIQQAAEEDPETFLSLEEQAALDPFHDKPLPTWDESQPDAADVEIKNVYELKPEIDPANADPGPLPELDTGGASPVFLVALALVVGLAGAFLVLAPEPPPTAKEEAAMLAERVQTTERTALRRAEHLAFRTRRIANARAQSQSAAPTICQRLLDTGRYELAQEVCAQAHELNPAHAGSYARALIAGQVFDNADVILRLRIAEDPNDRSAWQAVAELSRRKGDTPRERTALEALLRIEESLDPTEALRQRLEQLDADE